MLKNFFRAFLRFLVKPMLGAGLPVAWQRFWFVAIASGLLPPRGTRRDAVELGGVPAERTTPAAASGATLLYLHGGGYCIGSPRTCRGIAGHLARTTGAMVFAPRYRLAPEDPHPAALDDAVSAYRALLAQGVAPRSIVVAGDSAGAGLAVATAVALRDAGVAPPAALVLLSPWADLACTGATHTGVGARDPVLSTAGVRRWAADYLGGRAAEDPACSPLFADLHGLPPMLIQVGSQEILLADSTRLHARATAAGVAATLHEYPGMWHDFQMYAGLLREADQAIAQIAAFVRRCTAE